jgi:hypothetical protein
MVENDRSADPKILWSPPTKIQVQIRAQSAGVFFCLC